MLTDLQDKTQLTRRSLVRILTDSLRLDDFKRNPQQFIELATGSINRTKRLAIVNGIRYQRIGKDDYYAQELFDLEELTEYLKNMLAATKLSSILRLGLFRSFGEALWGRTDTGHRRVRQDTCPEQFKTGAPIHLAFDRLEAVDLALDLSGAPVVAHSRSHRRDVLL